MEGTSLEVSTSTGTTGKQGRVLPEVEMPPFPSLDEAGT